MADKLKARRMVTPKGQIYYAKLREPDTFQGKVIGYTIQMKFNKEDTEYLLKEIERELEAGKEAIDLKPGQKWSKEPMLGYHTDKNGDIVFKFKTSTTIKTRAGDEVKRVVPIFDTKGNKVETAIGNGSVGKVAFLLNPYWVSNFVNGVTLRLLAVQIINLVEYGQQSADSYGFGEEQGYVAPPEDDFEKAGTDTEDEEF